MRIKKLLRSNTAGGFISAAVWMYLLLMIFLWVLEYAGMVMQTQRVQDNTLRVLDGFVTENSQNIYRSIKNGHDLTEALAGNELYAACIRELGLQDTGSGWRCVDGSGKEQYTITGFSVSFIQDETLQLKVNYTISFPIEMGGQVFATANIPQQLSSCYHLKLE